MLLAVVQVVQSSKSCSVNSQHLLFSQARQDVAFGRFSITEVEALLLASLTLQIEYGDYDAKKHQGGFLRDILQEYIPANIYRAPLRNRALLHSLTDLHAWASSLPCMLAGRCAQSVLLTACLQCTGLHKPKIWERDLLKTYEKMTGFTEAFAKKNYLRVVEKSQTYGYTMFPVKQTHMKKEPAKVGYSLLSLLLV